MDGVFLLISAVFLAAGLGCAREDKKSAAPNPQRSASAAPGALAPTPSASTEQTAEPVVDYLDEQGALRVQKAMRSALLANDRKRVAASLLYPVIVHTMSWCTFKLHSADEVLAHYDDIFTSRTRRAIVGRETTWFTVGASAGGGLMLARGDVWLTARRTTNISADVWTLKDRTCEQWKLESIPDWLDGDWVASSITQVQGAVESPSRFKAASIRVDLRSSKVSVVLTPSRMEACRTLRYGYELEEGSGRDLTPGGNGFPSQLGREYFFDLECPKRRVERLYPYSKDVVSITADSAFVVFFKRKRAGVTTSAARVGEPCGAGVAVCGKWATCVAQWPDRSVRKPFDELCRSLDAMTGLAE